MGVLCGHFRPLVIQMIAYRPNYIKIIRIGDPDDVLNSKMVKLITMNRNYVGKTLFYVESQNEQKITCRIKA